MRGKILIHFAYSYLSAIMGSTLVARRIPVSRVLCVTVYDITLWMPTMESNIAAPAKIASRVCRDSSTLPV